ncbi:MAG: sulfite exporter TauE/SafE family protein [Alphaproteobacteria bacterium]|nr:sulfite exporter TauE/SafE family protein [Alphaproteobacteria bacterium]MBV9371295.1 sulfite exporter TauE/SafE family protein [Alphaproteobacteria bacterium]MBV9901759.1 sulfite exporter TauE/SafE family protein [Alphaproteobacteria bacterium]
MPTDLHFYLFAVPAVILIGLAKGGFSGLGALGTPLIALGIDPVRGAAILLPILIVQDAVGVAAFRRSWDGFVLAVMLPGAVAGVGLGYAFAASVSEEAVMAAVGAVSILFGAYRLWAERVPVVTDREPEAGGGASPTRKAPPPRSARSPSPSASRTGRIGDRFLGTLFGIATGFTSQIAHAGGPPFQMWVMPRRLPRDMFVGTSAIFFAVLNWIKVPAYVALGQFSRENLLAAAALFPLAVGSSLAGVKLVRRVPARKFYTIVYLLMLVTGGKLLLDGLQAA